MTRSAANGWQSGDFRARLLELSASLFASHGYAQVSVRDLAARLGVTTGAIYSNFNSKGELLAAILDVRITADMERSERTRTDFVWLPQVVHDSFLRTSERGQMRALLLEAAAASRTDPELRTSLRPTLTALIERWIDDYRMWQQTSGVDPDIDMADLLTVLWAIELGIGVLEAQGAASVNPVALADLIGGFLQSLEAPAAKKPQVEQLRHTGKSKGTHPTRKGIRSSRVKRPIAERSLPREPHGQQSTQARLVGAAIELFAEKGYGRVTVRDLARATGLTTGSIYGNFANKAILLVEAIETLITELEQQPAFVESGSPMEQVELHLQNFADRAQLRALLVEGAAAARSDPEVHDRLRDVELRHLELWFGGCERWLDACETPPTVDLQTAITAVWSAELGLALLEALDLYTPPLRGMAEVVRRLFSAFGLADPVAGSTSAPASKSAAGQSSSTS